MLKEKLKEEKHEGKKKRNKSTRVLKLVSAFVVASLFVASGATVLALFFCSPAGFAFAKYQFPGRKFLFLFLVATLIIPFHVTTVPLYVLYRKIGWIDEFWGLIFPGMANSFGIFFMRQYMLR